MEKKCVHSCKGLCNALLVAEQHEEKMIREYRSFASECDYPDVRQILEDLISERERAVRILREKCEMLKVRFETIDCISDSFA